MRRLKGQTGMSLVEATIILLVLMLLTGVLAPSIFDYFRDAQMVKVKEDCEAIGVSVVRLVRDVGPCLKFDGTQPGCGLFNRVDILVSRGNAVAGSVDLATAPAFASPDGVNINWDSTAPPAGADSMENQFVLNTPHYATPGQLGTWNFTYPAMMLGWRGAYLAPPIGPDPWGMPYLVNSMFLAVATSGGCAGSTEGCEHGGWDRDVICLSGGPNQIYQTPFAGSQGGIMPPPWMFGTLQVGDDFVFVISGDTR
jgi:hypothetical protein